jgi:quercetin dioxygenase-like cupin family protein
MMDRSPLFVHAERLTWQTVGDGVTREVLAYDSAIMMVRVQFAKGKRGAVHSHPHRQVTFVEKGSFEVEIQGERRTLNAGDSFMVPPDASHGVLALQDGFLLDVFTPARQDFLQAP